MRLGGGDGDGMNSRQKMTEQLSSCDHLANPRNQKEAVWLECKEGAGRVSQIKWKIQAGGHIKGGLLGIAEFQHEQKGNGECVKESRRGHFVSSYSPFLPPLPSFLPVFFPFLMSAYYVPYYMTIILVAGVTELNKRDRHWTLVYPASWSGGHRPSPV